MKLRFHTLLTCLFALISTAHLSLAPVAAKSSSGAYQHIVAGTSRHQVDIQFVAFGGGNNFSKTNITVDARQNLTSVGGTMVAGGDVTLSADGIVTLAGAVSTDYTSTVSNRNSGFLIVDTTEVSLTQSADFTSITAGGDVSVSGAQVVASLDASSAAFGLNAKSLIGIDEAGSAQRLEISGQGPAPAPHNVLG